MKRFLFICLTCAMMIGVAHAYKGPVEKYSYFEGEQIYGIICDGSVNIQLSEDPTATGVFAELPPKAAEMIVVDKTPDNYIRIKFGSDFTKMFKSKITIKVVVSMLCYAKINGSCDVICKGRFMRSGDVEINVDGSSSTMDYLDVKAENVKLSLNGMTKMTELTVEAKKLNIITNGVGPKIAFVGGKVKKCILETLGAGRSNINMINIPVDNMNAKVTGLSFVKANIIESADVDVIKGATFKYIGNGQVRGEGNFKHM